MNSTLLITPSEVVALAFAPTDHVRAVQISEAEIVAVQQKYMVPVFGELWDALCAGDYSDLAEEYIKPSLAHYVKARVLPSLASVTSLGVVEHNTNATKKAADSSLMRVVRATFDTAATLRRRAVDYVEAHSEHYPEYRSSKNILNRTRVESGIVL